MVSVIRPMSRRGVVAGTLALAMLLPGSLQAAAQSASTGTLVGSVTCGADAITPAVNVVVAPERLNLQTRTGSVGQFRLSNVPADQSLTINVTNPQDSMQISRYNVMVRPGETLDIGSMDLVTCPLVGLPTQPQDDSQRQQEQRGPGPDY
jgi:hypothetical protein